jgi:hypothetical protein
LLGVSHFGNVGVVASGCLSISDAEPFSAHSRSTQSPVLDVNDHIDEAMLWRYDMSYEGAIVSGYPSAATEKAIQANIVAAGYR